MSSLEKRCISSWKKHFSEFEFKIWNENNFDVNFCKFTKFAYEQKKYAFVSDVARIYALNSEGGIYLDTDMLFINPLPQKILDSRIFFGMESRDLYNAAIFGSHKGIPLLSSMLDIYCNLNSVDFEQFLIPQILTNELRNLKKGVDFISFSPEYFYPLPYKLRQFHYNKFITDKTIAIHLWNLSWRNIPSLNTGSQIIFLVKYWISYFYLPKSLKEYAKSTFY